MFYCVLNGEDVVSFYTGHISFDITVEDIKIMYKEVKNKELQDGYKIMQIEDSNIANKIMQNKSYFNFEAKEWKFEKYPKVEIVKQPTELELLQEQVKMLQEQVSKLG
jgi:hypothetical protein